ncbi:MAG: DUF1697 domain-containing protein [Acidimicrobiales bacterium]
MPEDRYVALVRGVNVGGRNRLAMPQLRDVLVDLGYGDIETYLQSGNALFTAVRTDATALGHEIERHLVSRLGLAVKVLVRTHADLAAVVAGNPFPEAVAEPTKVHVAFLSAEPDPERLASLHLTTLVPDEFAAGPRSVYLRYPNGSGRSKLTGALLERRLGLTATARNWNTVVGLLERSAVPPRGDEEVSEVVEVLRHP